MKCKEYVIRPFVAGSMPLFHVPNINSDQTGRNKCENVVIIFDMVSSHQWRLKEHFPLVHDDLVGAERRRPKEGDVFILEGLQRFGFTSFVHRHVISAHTEPQIMRETALLTL